jgi:GST-like protein
VDKRYVVYGQKGTGSVPVEATLLLLGEPYEVIERGPSEDRPAGNPMQQVPVLALPNGELMTESAAILIHLADSHPAARMSPALDDPRRPAFLRWMVYVAAQIYGQVWARDDPARLAAEESHKAVILERTAERIAHCWRLMDARSAPAGERDADRRSCRGEGQVASARRCMVGWFGQRSRACGSSTSRS